MNKRIGAEVIAMGAMKRIVGAALLATLLLCALAGCALPPVSGAAATPAKAAAPDAAKASPIAAPRSEDPSPAPIPSQTAPPIGDEPRASSAPESVGPQTPAVTPAANSGFEVHFIDVGQADAALVICDGRAMMIDGGNVADSSLIYSYLKNHGVSYIDYMICTHPDEDHVGGLAGALNYADVGVVYCPVASHGSDAFQSFLKYLGKRGASISIPNAGDSFALGGADVEILGPRKSYSDVNDMSVVLRVTYGATSFLFTGDAGREAEQDILDAGADVSATVLKLGHHGSDTSSSYVWLREVMPQYAVISVGANNSYGHPTEAVLSRLRDADVVVYRTDMQGDIVCVSDGQTVSFRVEKNAGAQTNPTRTDAGANTPKPTQDTPKPTQDTPRPTQGTPKPTDTPNPTDTPKPTDTPDPGGSGDYIGNVNSHKFHRSSCKTLPDEKNRIYFDTREEAVAAGYEPCKNCNP